VRREKTKTTINLCVDINAEAATSCFVASGVVSHSQLIHFYILSQMWQIFILVVGCVELH